MAHTQATNLEVRVLTQTEKHKKNPHHVTLKLGFLLADGLQARME